MKKILPIKKHNEIKLFTHHSIPLCMPLISEFTEAWYMSCFVNIVYKYDQFQYFDYVDYKMFYEYAVDRDILCASTIPLINNEDFFSTVINQGKYIYSWLDQYYVSATEYYEVRHDIHPIMIYGYDDEKNVYHCVAFSPRKSVYFIEVPREEYHRAISEMLKTWEYINDEDIFVIFRLKGYKITDFNLECFINELEKYVNGYGAYRTSNYTVVEKEKESKTYNRSACGIEVTRIFYEILGKEIEATRDFDYRVLYMICENKKLIYRRLEYISNIFSLPQEMINLLSDYSSIAKVYQGIMNLFYKYSLRETNGVTAFILPRDEKHIEDICLKLKNAYQQEKCVIKKIIPLLQEFDIYNKFRKYILYKSEENGDNKIVDLQKERYIDSIVIYNDYKKYNGKFIIKGEDQYECDIDNSSLHNFYVVPVNKIIKGCHYIPNENVGNTIVWLLEPKEIVDD